MAWRDDEQRAWFEGFIKQVEQELCGYIEAQGDRFPSCATLLARYRTASRQLLDQGADAEPGYQSAHNEICVAVTILEDVTERPATRLDYEPAMASCEKRFDFRAAFQEGPPTWVEVKTIQPAWRDDWDRFMSHVEQGHFPHNSNIVLSKDWLGGELYHNSFAARSKMLDYTLETEGKIADCIEAKGENVVVLALFTNGFSWHADELEDFVFFYRHGVHCDGDPFRVMEAHEIERRGIRLTRSIDHFAFIKRPSTELRPRGGVWSVKPPRWPPWAGE